MILLKFGACWVGDSKMILAPLTGAALVLSVATGPNVAPNGSTQLSVQQKNMAMQQFVRTATDCAGMKNAETTLMTNRMA